MNDWLKLGAIGAVGAYFGGVQLPEWSGLAASGAVIAGIAVLFASGKIEDLIPDPPVVTLFVVNAKRTDILQVWELSPDKFEDLRVEAGVLNPLPRSIGECYECYHYDPSENVAVGTWRLSKPDSEIVGRHDVADALEQVEDLRDRIEPEARKGRYLRQHMPGILRVLDRERARTQNEALDPHLTPSMNGPTIDEVVADQMPDDLLPDRLRNDRAEEVADEVDEWTVGMDLLDDGEALEPVGQLANDGGKTT